MTKWIKQMLAITALLLAMCVGVTVFVQGKFFKEELITSELAVMQVEKLYAGTVSSVKKEGEVFHLQLERQGAIYALDVNERTGRITNLKLQQRKPNAVLSNKKINDIIAAHTKGIIQKIELLESADSKHYDVTVLNGTIEINLMLNAYTGEILNEKNVSQNVIAETVTPVDPSAHQITKPTSSKGSSEKEESNSSTILSQQQATQIALQQLQGKVNNIEYEESTNGGYYLIEIQSINDEAVFQIHAVSGKILSITWDDAHYINQKIKQEKDHQKQVEEQLKEQEKQSQKQAKELQKQKEEQEKQQIKLEEKKRKQEEKQFEEQDKD